MQMKPIMEGWRNYVSEALNVALKGAAYEVQVAAAMNSYFDNNALDYIATAEGGAGWGSDVVVKDTSGNLVHSYEVKTSKGSRIDFGQFRISYDPGSGWSQSTGLDNDVVKTIFSEIKSTVDSTVAPKTQPFPTGPRLNTESATMFWESFLGRPRVKSLSGDIVKIPVSKGLIQDYYSKKGDNFIILGDDIYSLSEHALPSLAEALRECYVVFRVKYHGKNTFSYTAALRGKFIDTKETDFLTAMKKIYSSE